MRKPSAENPVGEGSDFSELASKLEAEGIAVTLVEVAAWGPEKRRAASGWLAGEALKPSFLLDVRGGKKARDEVKEPPQVDARGEVGEKVDEVIASAGSEDVSNPDFDDLPRARPMHRSFDRIVETVFVEDVGAMYEMLTQRLREQGESKGEASFARHKLATAAESYFDAKRLLITGKKLLSEWESQNAVVVGAMREKANDSLQVEKDKKERSKAITDADVEARAAVLFTDQWRSATEAKRRYELTIRGLEDLAEAWSKECWGLAALSRG